MIFEAAGVIFDVLGIIFEALEVIFGAFGSPLEVWGVIFEVWIAQRSPWGSKSDLGGSRGRSETRLLVLFGPFGVHFGRLLGLILRSFLDEKSMLFSRSFLECFGVILDSILESF